MSGHVTVHRDLLQGSTEWLQVRLGMLTASRMDLVLTPKTLKACSNDKERRHVYQLAYERVTKFVDPQYVSHDMERGQAEEIEARRYYQANYGKVEQVGFVVNTRHGFPLGCSPDGLVGHDGVIEVKSRRGDLQFEVIADHVPAETVPDEHMLQCQTALIVTERAWLDYVSFSNGMPMATIRVEPRPDVQRAILDAAKDFERRVQAKVARYHETLASLARLVPTERIMFTEELQHEQ